VQPTTENTALKSWNSSTLPNDLQLIVEPPKKRNSIRPGSSPNLLPTRFIPKNSFRTSPEKVKNTLHMMLASPKKSPLCGGNNIWDSKDAIKVMQNISKDNCENSVSYSAQDSREIGPNFAYSPKLVDPQRFKSDSRGFHDILVKASYGDKELTKTPYIDKESIRVSQIETEESIPLQEDNTNHVRFLKFVDQASMKQKYRSSVSQSLNLLDIRLAQLATKDPKSYLIKIQKNKMKTVTRPTTATPSKPSFIVYNMGIINQ